MYRPAGAEWLRTEGHEVFSVYDEARGIGDETIIDKALAENWRLITNDKDFGELVFRERRKQHGGGGVRLSDERALNKINVLQSLLKNHADKLNDQFVTVTEKTVRFASV